MGGEGSRGCGGGQSCGHMEVISPHVASLQPADASSGRCLFTRGGLWILKPGRPVSPEEQTRARSEWSSETFQGSRDLVWIKVKTTLIYIYVYIYFSEVQTCGEYTGGHSELKGVIVAQGSWQKERKKKTLSGKKWLHVM